MNKSVFRCRVLIALASVIGVLGADAFAGPPQPATDEGIKELLASAGDAEDYKKSSLLYVLDEADVYVENSGLATTESCQVIKILTDAGIRSQSVLVNNFDPDTNRVTFRAVKIHRKDGGVEDVPLGSVIPQPTPQQAMYWGGEQQLLSIPRLNIGDALEIRISKIGFNIAYLGGGTWAPCSPDTSGLQPPMPGHWYEVTNFQGSHPIISKRYSVHMPTDMPVQYEVYNGALKSSIWFSGDKHIYTFSDEDIAPVDSEPHMVSRDDCTPKLVMATLEDWESKSRWFHEVNETQFDADAAIRAKVAEITDGLETEEEKIAACHHWVSDNIRYVGTSRGPREGFTLHSGIETFEDRGGVCKDIAGMLITMLRVLDHEVYPSLTMAGSRVEEIPADQFNHTITVMRYPDGTFRILDPTWCPTSREIWSSREALQGLVYGTPEGENLTLSPYYSPEYNRLKTVAKTSINTDGDLKTDIRMDAAGYCGTYLRRYAERDPKPDQLARFEGYLNLAPNARIEQLAHIESRDYSRDSWLEMEVSAPAYAAGSEAHMFKLPMMRHPFSYLFSRDLFYGFDEEERDFGLRMRATRLLQFEETIKLPDGWKIISSPEARSFDSPSASIDFTITAGDGELTYSFEIALKDHTIQPENYAGFKKVIDMMIDIGDDWVLCTGS